MRYPLALVQILAFCAGLNCIESLAEPSTNWGMKPERHTWSSYVTNAIAARGDRLAKTIPADVQKYCPRYRKLTIAQRRVFWSRLLSLLAHYESSYRPSVSYKENLTGGHGRPVVSRGLLQISIESANAKRYACGVKRESALHNSKVNLECGVRIATVWVTSDGTISGRSRSGGYRGMARYWGPFRKADKVAVMRRKLSQTADCRQ
jgi:hypothetical protein